jgi:hypothetical protein
VTDDLLDALPALYGSLRSTRPWFSAFDKPPNGVCTLTDPEHILVLRIDGDRVDVMNKGIAILPEDARRVCEAIFASAPGTTRIRMEVPFPPSELGLPHRVMETICPLLIDLPETEDEYHSSLGSRTRKNLRNYQNRLCASHPDAETDVRSPNGDEMRSLVDQFVCWNIARMRAQGRTSGFAKDRKRKDQVTDLMVQGRADAVTTHIDGHLAAVEFIHLVGRAAAIYAGSFDQRYADLHLGFLSTYWAIRQTVRAGARRCDLMWTGDYYKRLFGARPVTASRLSVFQNERDRLLALDEVRQITWRRSKERVRSVLGIR